MAQLKASARISDGANSLWSLYNKEAQTHDEALFQALLADMSGIPTFVRRVLPRVDLPAFPKAGLSASVLTTFLVDSLKNLQPDPIQQSVATLAQISQQIASVTPQVFVPSTPTPPYPVFHPSKTDMAMNSLWTITRLDYSLISATLIQQGAQHYLGVFQRWGHPLKRAVSTTFFRRCPATPAVGVFCCR
ncbi:hypothetical protein H4582DRAFT_1212748 [Lactarius indigo]|nr:hypothetical protein H4582DRAFT_1212748 [Lactarius indigo]